MKIISLTGTLFFLTSSWPEEIKPLSENQGFEQVELGSLPTQGEDTSTTRIKEQSTEEENGMDTIFHSNEQAAAYRSNRAECNEQAADLLLAPYLPVVQNRGFTSLENITVDVADNANGKPGNLGFFNKHYHAGNVSFLVAIADPKAAFEREFGNIQTYRWDDLDPLE